MAGISNVGFSKAVLLARAKSLFAADICENKLIAASLEHVLVSVVESDAFLRKWNLEFITTTDSKTSQELSDFAIVAAPADFRRRITVSLRLLMLSMSNLKALTLSNPRMRWVFMTSCGIAGAPTGLSCFLSMPAS